MASGDKKLVADYLGIKNNNGIIEKLDGGLIGGKILQVFTHTWSDETTITLKGDADARDIHIDDALDFNFTKLIENSTLIFFVEMPFYTQKFDDLDWVYISLDLRQDGETIYRQNLANNDTDNTQSFGNLITMFDNRPNINKEYKFHLFYDADDSSDLDVQFNNTWKNLSPKVTITVMEVAND